MKSTRSGDFLALCLISFKRWPWIYGAQLHRKLCADLDRDVSIPQVFAAIEALRADGMLREKLIATPKGEKGPPRAGYALTKKGSSAVDELIGRCDDAKSSPNSKPETVTLLKKLIDEHRY